MPSPHAPNTAYHPYARGVHSRHAPNTAYHPYARSALPTCSRHHLSLHLSSALPTPLTILTLVECTPDTAYHPYACGVPSQHAPDTTDPYASILHP
ncbi:hypothetical protein O181_053127 [Austropuccinia psidii MF-1]|uniref:Uncharacterized protein n=1 Tax=Austropuccinia psidii MF-1 TaxID=1389203 RepID=A0A9Q3E4A9_9BASI|nr:hypothetical protein [Austropuccinia psidii MF-1]